MAADARSSASRDDAGSAFFGFFARMVGWIAFNKALVADAASVTKIVRGLLAAARRAASPCPLRPAGVLVGSAVAPAARKLTASERGHGRIRLLAEPGRASVPEVTTLLLAIIPIGNIW